MVLPLRAAAAGEGIDLLAVGIDPLNTAERAPLLIHAKRYERMAEYLGRLGPSGARMMRQTAAFQVSVDFDDEPWLRWRVLNAAAPYVVAIFANSPIYAGEPTGHQSARADVWRNLDPARTGIPFDERAPLQAYLDFALTAPAILLPTLDGEHRPFGEWLTRANPTAEEWQDHLSTLFPEVRPRGPSRAQVGGCDRARVVCRSARADGGHPLRFPRPAGRRRSACRSPISGSSSEPDGWGCTTRQ